MRRNLTDEEEFKAFEKTALGFLRTLGFTPTGYYPYPHCSDVSGYLAPSPPLKVPTKTMAEIVKDAPTRVSIEGFHKLAKDSLAERLILVCRVHLTDLDPDVQSLVDKLGIEFFDETTISEELEKRKIGKTELQAYSKLYDVVAPLALAEALPEIARQKIPDAMKEYVEKLGLKPWQVFEQAVYSVFHYCFGYTVRKLGEECLFEHEPEGLVIVGETLPFAMIYECKTAQQSYVMTSDHELRYKDYIRAKIDRVKIMEKATLKYFVIVAPEFSGTVGERRERIFKDTQVLAIFMTADTLRSIAKWASKFPNDIKRLIDLREIFRLDEETVSDSSVTGYMKKFEDENKTRW